MSITDVMESYCSQLLAVYIEDNCLAFEVWMLRGSVANNKTLERFSEEHNLDCFAECLGPFTDINNLYSSCYQ